MGRIFQNFYSPSQYHREQRHNKKYPHELFYNTEPKFLSLLQDFGEMGVLKVSYSSIVNKLDNKGKTMMFVGYSDTHGNNVYSILNISTLKIFTTRYVKCLNKSYG